MELRREDSGAVCLAGRELDPADALAGKASIDAEAVRLRNAGLPGTLAQIRAAVLLDRIAQCSPWDRLALPPPEPEPDDGDRAPGDDPDLYEDEAPDAPVDPVAPDDDDDVDEDDSDDEEAATDAEEEEDEGRPAGFDGPPPGSPFDQTGRKTPMPALINITVPVGTLLGWSNAPAEAGS